MHCGNPIHACVYTQRCIRTHAPPPPPIINKKLRKENKTWKGTTLCERETAYICFLGSNHILIVITEYPGNEMELVSMHLINVIGLHFPIKFSMTELPQRVRARTLVIRIWHICRKTYVSFLDSRLSFTVGVGLVIYPASSQAAAAVSLLGSKVSYVGEIVISEGTCP